MEFKVGDWVLVENKYLGRIKEAVNRADMPKELFCFCVETFYGGCWYHISDVKKIDTKKLERLIQECVVDE